MEFFALLSKRTARPLIIIICLLVSYITIFPDPVTASGATPSPDIEIEYVSKANISLVELSAGAVGDGRLLYFVKNGDQRTLRLMVHLYKTSETSTATAEVYEVPENLNVYADKFPLQPSQAAIIMEGLDGWWVKDNVVNYNLDLETRSPFYSMWSGEWAQLLAPGEPAAHIQIRDTDGDGVPDWDLRSMIPEFPGRGYLHVNYAERRCSTPEAADRGVSPEWPYIALAGTFEQQPGRFRPPIVIDWETGKVKFFSEVVTVRNQNCSYSFYSLKPIQPGELNHLDFETPFAFYDLSGGGVGYPNLILRTERYPANDIWVGGNNPEYELVRFSWRNAPGDWLWDYKVDVLGLHPYDFETPIAGGLATVDAPPYDLFPTWVVNHTWPAVTFVDPEGSHVRSSEGIYEWSAASTGTSYYHGTASAPYINGFSDITAGYRGEYRFQQNKALELYFSPVDNQLHLKWAEQGIWRLNGQQVITVANLNSGAYIDAWLREAKVIPSENPKTTSPSEKPIAPEIIEALYALPGYLLHITGTNLTLVASDYPPALFETLPPTDHDTWERQRDLLAPYADQRRDPQNLKSWLDAFPGPHSAISGVTLANLRYISSGFRFELSLSPGFQETGPDLLGITALAPGTYLVENDGKAFTVTPLVPAKVSLTVTRPAGESGAASAWVTLQNTGLADAMGLALVTEVVGGPSGPIELSRQTQDVLAGQAVRMIVHVPPAVAPGQALRFRLEDASGQTLAELPIADNGKAADLALARRILSLSTAGGLRLGWLLGLVFFGVIPFVTLLKRRPAGARKNVE